ncbi:MAG TPA: hypothetical protein VHC97_20460 [Thermoanaerobaculia bacterium]|nr:hypothetical protein [Thermoanaerobaculia bacterium]
MSVSLNIISIDEIDSARETFRADFYISFQWHDPALENVGPEKTDCSKAGQPLIEFMNSRDLEPRGEELLTRVSGNCLLQRRYAGTFSSRMDLEDFPLDEQFLTIALESQNETSDEMFFSFEPKGGMAVDVRGRTIPIRKDAVLGSEIHLPEWTITAANVRESTTYYYTAYPYSHLQFDVKITRRVGYYLWKIMFVMVMLVALSWAVFLIDPSDIGNRMAVSITLLLAAVAFSFVTGSLIPRISYLTLLDLYVLSCYVLLFLAPAESLIVYRLRAQDKVARRIDRLALVCFPAVFLLLHLLLWMHS